MPEYSLVLVFMKLYGRLHLDTHNYFFQTIGSVSSMWRKVPMMAKLRLRVKLW